MNATARPAEDQEAGEVQFEGAEYSEDLPLTDGQPTPTSTIDHPAATAVRDSEGAAVPMITKAPVLAGGVLGAGIAAMALL